MKKFVRKLFLFISIPAIFLLVVILFIPATPRSQQSLLFSKLDKDHRLATLPAPRLILFGGSNLSFGINSALIEQEIGLQPVNTAIQATIGTTYMMDTILEYVQPGDVLVLSAEYSQFFGKNASGGEELLRIVLDVDRDSIKKLKIDQWANILVHLPEYAISKLDPTEYIFKEDPEVGIYDRASFNEYGDATVHWKYKHSDFPPYDRIEGKFNWKLIEALGEFDQEVRQKGAIFYITFPGLQEATYLIMEEQIQQVYDVLSNSGLILLGTPERYKMNELLMYNTPYHLNKEGVDYRTQLLIEDLKEAKAFKEE